MLSLLVANFTGCLLRVWVETVSSIPQISELPKSSSVPLLLPALLTIEPWLRDLPYTSTASSTRSDVLLTYGRCAIKSSHRCKCVHDYLQPRLRSLAISGSMTSVHTPPIRNNCKASSKSCLTRCTLGERRFAVGTNHYRIC